jgi:pimeloyl-ACP methyl ester carboxylesterase
VFQPTELDSQLFLHILSFPPGLQVRCSFIAKPKDNASASLFFSFYSGMHFLNFVSCFSILGIPGLKASLLDEFGVRLLTYDLPGFGESDPHPNRNLETSAMDMLLLADAVGVNDKFWVVGYSSGSMHAWASLRYIPDKLAGMMFLLFYDISI